MWIPELEMYYYKARFYSYKLGRFLQTDPIGYKDQFNLCAYVGNDPINNTDLTGMYNCQEGSDCEPVDKYRAELKAVAKQTRSGSRVATSAARNAQRALKALGARGDDNGLAIREGETGAISPANIVEDTDWLGSKTGTQTITIDYTKVREGAAANGISEATYGAVVLGHEAIHRHQLLVAAANLMGMERQAYAADLNIGRALGFDQNPRGTPLEVYTRRRAYGSCMGETGAS